MIDQSQQPLNQGKSIQAQQPSTRAVEVVGLPITVGLDMTDSKPVQKLNVVKRRVQRHSPDRLLRQKLVLPGEITVSAEKHKGRLVVRVESPDDRQ